MLAIVASYVRTHTLASGRSDVVQVDDLLCQALFKGTKKRVRRCFRWVMSHHMTRLFLTDKWCWCAQCICQEGGWPTQVAKRDLMLVGCSCPCYRRCCSVLTN